MAANPTGNRGQRISKIIITHDQTNGLIIIEQYISSCRTLNDGYFYEPLNFSKLLAC